jgi:hypothetical protein
MANSSTSPVDGIYAPLKVNTLYSPPSSSRSSNFGGKAAPPFPATSSANMLTKLGMQGKIRIPKKAKKPAFSAKVGKTMGEFKAGTLHSGSKTGPAVQSRNQAVAIALNQAKKATK